MFSEKFGTEEALFFRGNGCEKDRAGRHRLAAGPNTGELQENAATGGVVDGAVIDVVALWPGIVDAEVIVVRGVENSFGPTTGIRTIQTGHHIARVKGPNLAGDMRFQFYLELEGLEIS